MVSADTGPKNRWIGLGFVAISLLVVSLNDTILTTALPVIAGQLESSASQIQWIADAYILVFASLLLTMGSLSDRYGRKQFLQLGVGLFGAFSLLAAFANTTPLLIGARALQGIGAAIIMPSTLSLITAMFPEPHERARAIGIWSAVFGVGVGIGPLVGGWLVVSFHWSAAFLFNLPFVVIAIIGGQFFLPQSRDECAPRADIPGVILSSLGLFALIFALIDAGSAGWTHLRVAVFIVCFFLLLAVFIWWERRADHAMLPMYLFKNMSFTAANIGMTMAQFTLLGIVFYVPQFLQGVLGFNAWEAAIRLVPIAILAVIVMTQSAFVVRRFGIKWAVAGGFLIATVGMLLLAAVMRPYMPYWQLLVIAIVLVLGVDTAIPAITVSIMGSVPPTKAGVGSAMNEMTGQIGGALGIATLGSLLNNVYLRRIVPLKSELDAGTYAGVARSIFNAHRVAEKLPAEVARQVTQVADAAFTAGLAEALSIGGLNLLTIAVITAVLLPAHVQQTPEPENGRPSVPEECQV